MKRLVAAVAVAALSLTLAACGGDDDDSDSTGGTGATSSGGGTPATLKLDTAFGTGGISLQPLSTSAHDRFMAVAQAQTARLTPQASSPSVTATRRWLSPVSTTAASSTPASARAASPRPTSLLAARPVELARAVAVQSDGKIVIAGAVREGPHRRR